MSNTPPGRVYFRVDAGYRDDERFVALDHPLAELLYLRALAWSKARNTDGHYPAVIVAKLERELNGWARPTVAGELLLEGDDLSSMLVGVGLWEVFGDGYRIPPERWARWQTTAAELDAARARERDRKARYRQSHRDATSSPTGTEGTATPRERQRERQRQREKTPSQSSSSPGAQQRTDDEDRPSEWDERVRGVAAELARRDLARREADRADQPIAQRARWLTVAIGRRLEDNGPEVARLLGDGMTPARIVDAILGIEAQAGSPATAARARRSQANGAAG